MTRFAEAKRIILKRAPFYLDEKQFGKRCGPPPLGPTSICPVGCVGWLSGLFWFWKFEKSSVLLGKHSMEPTFSWFFGLDLRPLLPTPRGLHFEVLSLPNLCVLCGLCVVGCVGWLCAVGVRFGAFFGSWKIREIAWGITGVCPFGVFFIPKYCHKKILLLLKYLKK